MGNNGKLCPHCGGKMFAAKITRGCIVESDENGFKLLKENTDKFDIEVVKCGRCRKEITNNDLVTGVNCKTCGRPVNPSELDENGVCSVCNAQKERSELANASREDLIRMLLEVERKVKVPSMPEVVDVVEEKSAKEISEPVSDLVPDVPKEKKTKRSVSRKKNDDVASQDKQEDAPKEPQTVPTSDESFIANQQEAPFPDLGLPDSIAPMNQPEVQESPNEVSGEQLGVNNFQMFQTEEKF